MTDKKMDQIDKIRQNIHKNNNNEKIVKIG